MEIYKKYEYVFKEYKMIELTEKSDTILIDNLDLRHCVENRMARLPGDFLYPQYGYFCVLENVNELYAPLHFSYGDVSRVDDLFEYIELVEEDETCFEIVTVLTQDFGVSIIAPKALLSPSVQDQLRLFKEY